MKGILFLAFGVATGMYIGAQMKIAAENSCEVVYNNGTVRISRDDVRVLDHEVFKINEDSIDLFSKIRISIISKRSS